jgi:hypothetical protein
MLIPPEVVECDPISFLDSAVNTGQPWPAADVVPAQSTANCLKFTEIDPARQALALNCMAYACIVREEFSPFWMGISNALWYNWRSLLAVICCVSKIGLMGLIARSPTWERSSFHGEIADRTDG